MHNIFVLAVSNFRM